MLSKHHRDSPPLAKASRWNLSKFVVIKHFGWESLNVQPSCCLDVVVYMLNCVFWRHILLEIEFKSRVDMGSDSNRYSVQRYSPWAAAQLSTPKKKKKNRNGGILRLRLAYGRRSNKYISVCWTRLDFLWAPANTFLFKFPYKTIIVKKSEISDSFLAKTTCVIWKIIKNYI